MERDLTVGNEKKVMLQFALPMIVGNLLQQFYNIADSFIVGRFIGPEALAAVGTSFALMTFLTSAIIGLCMGSSVVFSMFYGAKDEKRMGDSFFVAFLLIALFTVVINLLTYVFTDGIIHVLRIDSSIRSMTKEYLVVIFGGICFIFLYNFFAAILRSMGNSTVPVICIGVSAVLNIGLDLLFVVGFHWGIAGAAWATITAQGVSALLIMVYTLTKVPLARLSRNNMHFDRALAKEIAGCSALTSVQQSIMNLGILMVQGLVNSFGVSVMAAFAAGVKIDAFAYMPLQDFGNAFSTYIAQNKGAGKTERIHRGIRSAIQLSTIFSLLISFIIFFFATPLLTIFIAPDQTEILRIGTSYLRIEGVFYLGIGLLFLLYGLYRGLGHPGMSVILTVISLGTRVLLAYLLAPVPAIGLTGIWSAIPIGWLLADLTGLIYYAKKKNTL
ncbi:MATE family efflux transporter [Lactonifactor longoviformis]|uniref:MATE family efflux transporter n=1 Tax=Lactonifactor longoviformis TaxID=341220 RepID=UPI0036F379B1